MSRIDAGIECPWCGEHDTLERMAANTYYPGMHEARCPHCGQEFHLETPEGEPYTASREFPEWVACWRRLADLCVNAHRYSAAAFTAKYMTTMKEGGLTHGV